MKKIIFSILLLFGAVLGAQAQQNPYLGEVNLGFSYGPFADQWAALSIHPVHGARIGDHFSVGGGVGLEFLAGVNDDSCSAGEPEFVCCHHSESKLLVPLYLNLKGYLDASKPNTAYLTLDVGVVPHFDSDKVRASLSLSGCGHQGSSIQSRCRV